MGRSYLNRFVAFFEQRPIRTLAVPGTFVYTVMSRAVWESPMQVVRIGNIVSTFVASMLMHLLLYILLLFFVWLAYRAVGALFLRLRRAATRAH
jgi:hypothetical protein